MKKLVPLKSVYAFIAVAETGSMTDAARVLYVSHSAVSQAIKSLEQLVNKPLFQRVGRRVVLNAAGKRYYRKIAPALEQVIEATEELAKTPNAFLVLAANVFALLGLRSLYFVLQAMLDKFVCALQ